MGSPERVAPPPATPVTTAGQQRGPAVAGGTSPARAGAGAGLTGGAGAGGAGAVGAVASGAVASGAGAGGAGAGGSGAGRVVAGHTLHGRPLVVAFVLLAAAITFAVAAGAPWWLVAAGVVGPDLSFLAGIGTTPVAPGLMPARVVPVYNTVHHPLGPALLLAVAAVLASAPLSALSLAWASHLAWDRGVGYTLRRRDGSTAP